MVTKTDRISSFEEKNCLLAGLDRWDTETIWHLDKFLNITKKGQGVTEDQSLQNFSARVVTSEVTLLIQMILESLNKSILRVKVSILKEE